MRLFYFKFTERVGYRNLSTQHSSIVNGVGTVFFFTWGSIYLFGPVDFGIVKDLYNDFNLQWCADIGVQL